MSSIRERIGKVVSIHPKLTAENWSLYTDEPGADGAASCMNAQLAKLVNAGLDRSAVRDEMVLVLNKFSKFGATDTAVHETLEYFLDEIYGDE